MRRVHSMPFGAEITSDGVRFALWAPTARDVRLVLDGAELPADGGRGRLAPPRLARGTRRQPLRLQDRRRSRRAGPRLPLPARRRSRPQPRRRSCEPMTGPTRPGRGRPWEETVLYEVHVGNGDAGGNLCRPDRAELESLRDLGITAIELMPIGEFPGRRNWGYDGVLPYAPDAAYGSPDDLKRLVERAHALGLMVFLDVVYNHFGPSGNYLHAYAKSFFTERHPTPWGAGINVDGEGSRIVRDFFFHNALYWLEEYHFDGLRFDAVHAIIDDGKPHFIEELANRIRQAIPDRQVHLVLENEANQARWLGRDDGPDAEPSYGAMGGRHPQCLACPPDRRERRLLRGLCEQAARASRTRRWRRASPIRAIRRRTRTASHAANPRAICRRPPSSRSCRTTTRSATAPSASASRTSIPAGAPRPGAGTLSARAADPPAVHGRGMGGLDAVPVLRRFRERARPRESGAGWPARRVQALQAFTDPEMSQKIPDPTDRATFERSKIDWQEIGALAASGGSVADARSCSTSGTREIVPLLKSDYLRLAATLSHPRRRST